MVFFEAELSRANDKRPRKMNAWILAFRTEIPSLSSNLLKFGSRSEQNVLIEVDDSGEDSSETREWSAVQLGWGKKYRFAMFNQI